MAAEGWYTEIYNRDGTRLKSVRILQDYTAVLLVIKKARKHEMVRVRAPRHASPAQVQQLRDLGVISANRGQPR
jgi:hypothetical protein